MKFCFRIVLLLLLLLLSACSTLKLKPAKFAWPVESVLVVDNEGNVTDERYSISFNTSAVFYEEFKDSSLAYGSQIRLLCDDKGYYFLIGENFKNVYVFEIADGSFSLENQILVSESGIINPALNQRSPFIELLTGEESTYLTNEGIHREQK